MNKDTITIHDALVALAAAALVYAVMFVWAL